MTATKQSGMSIMSPRREPQQSPAASIYDDITARGCSVHELRQVEAMMDMGWHGQAHRLVRQLLIESEGGQS